MNIRMLVVMLSLFTIAYGATGCGHTHTERIVEREVPTSSTTVVR